MSADDEDLERDDFPVVHCLVAAVDRPAPDTAAWPSIFDLAAAASFGYVWSIRLKRRVPAPAGAPALQDQVHLNIQREPGRVVCRRVHHQDTDAWQQQEAARRARQVLPRPPRQTFKLKGSGAKA